MKSTSPEVEGDKKEVSGGIITTRALEDSREYLLLKHENGGHWSFPKGHLEEGEQPREAAVRELKEETGLTLKEFVPRFNREIKYTFESGGRKVLKTVIYFLGIVSRVDSVKLSPEHLDYDWLSCREARERLTYENDKELLDRAEKHLKEDSCDD